MYLLCYELTRFGRKVFSAKADAQYTTLDFFFFSFRCHANPLYI